MTDYIKQLESKVKDCKNTNTIFDTREYVLLEDAKEVLSQALNIPVVSQAKRAVCPDCGDYGRIYNEDATSRKTCPCHY